MGILRNQKGQAVINGIMMAVIGLIMLAAFLPIINDVVGVIAMGNMSSFSNTASILMLLGLTGIIVVIGVLYSALIVPFFGGGPQQGQIGGGF
jgi:hypothetical protein